VIEQPIIKWRCCDGSLRVTAHADNLCAASITLHFALIQRLLGASHLFSEKGDCYEGQSIHVCVGAMSDRGRLGMRPAACGCSSDATAIVFDINNQDFNIDLKGDSE
jgi:hypothetical protein